MKTRTLVTVCVLCVALSGCATGAQSVSSRGSDQVGSVAAPTGSTSAAESHKPLWLGPMCTSGGGVVVVTAKDARTIDGHPTVVASVGRPVDVTVAVVDVVDVGAGRILEAHIGVDPPGTIAGSSTDQSDLVRIDYAGDAVRQPTPTKLTLSFTPPFAGNFPIVVRTRESASDSCAQAAKAGRAGSTGAFGNGIIGWVSAS